MGKTNEATEYIISTLRKLIDQIESAQIIPIEVEFENVLQDVPDDRLKIKTFVDSGIRKFIVVYRDPSVDVSGQIEKVLKTEYS